MKKGLFALSPIVTMVALLILFSVFYGGVSNAPLLFIFVITAIVSVAMTPGIALKERVSLFSQGAGSPNLLLMVWIFMLAGAFAASAKAMGAAEAMVDLTLHFLPARFALTGLFLAACVTSLCMGTSVGTIVALMPIAAGLADKTGMVLPLDIRRYYRSADAYCCRLGGQDRDGSAARGSRSRRRCLFRRQSLLHQRHYHCLHAVARMPAPR